MTPDDDLIKRLDEWLRGAAQPSGPTGELLADCRAALLTPPPLHTIITWNEKGQRMVNGIVDERLR